jgi:hypothetical protein
MSVENLSQLREGLRVKFRRAKSLIVRPAARADNPYATHLPVLIGLARLLKIRKVLEFGCGQYSTLTFLDRQAFPDLVSLDSFEHDPDWIAQLSAHITADPRVKLNHVRDSIREVIPRLDFADYDLIFIDDSLTAPERAATIGAVAGNCHPSNCTVIHDYEVEDYRRAARAFRHRFAFTAFNPQTGVVWNNGVLKRSQLKALDALIKQYSRKHSAEDARLWTSALDGINE